MSSIREGGRGSGGGLGGHRVRAGLVIAEMTLAVVLLTGAGLLIRSFIELSRVDPGFQPERAVAFRVMMQGEEYQGGQQIRDRVGQMLERLRSLPGVTATAVTSTLPLSGGGAMVDFQVGDQPPPPNVNAEIAIAGVTPDYFRAIGTPLLRGRPLEEQDRTGSPLVALINEAGVRRWFPDEDPIGKTVRAAGAEREIVGVFADILQRDPGQPAMPQLFAPYDQRTSRSVRFVVRTAGDPLALASDIRAVVRAADPNLPMGELTPLGDLLSTSMARPRFYTSLLTLFAGIALLLAATGIFGVLSYSVAQRAREISIRMALGAEATSVVRLIVGRAMTLVAIGVVVGVAFALAMGSLIRSQLFGVSVIDPVTLGAVVLVLVASALLASWLPARRAAAMQPLDALRES